MERRYQVFVSSTFDDLEEERREVIQALLSMGCFPAAYPVRIAVARLGVDWDR